MVLMFPTCFSPANSADAPAERWIAVGRESGTGQTVRAEGATQGEAITNLRGRMFPVDLWMTWRE